MEKQERKISLKKLLLTILCTTIVSIFVGNTVLLVDTVPQWLETEKILSINRNSKYLIEIGENNQDNVKQLEEKYKEERALFGEKYPAEMMHLMQIANYFTNRIIKVYTLSILIGVSTGAIIYIISIQRAKGKQLIIELIISLLIVFGLVLFTNLGYEAYINNHGANRGRQPHQCKHRTASVRIRWMDHPRADNRSGQNIRTALLPDRKTSLLSGAGKANSNRYEGS